MPGRHAGDTDPVGGDFVVTVDDDQINWTAHQFTHDDIFYDLEMKAKYRTDAAGALMRAYAKVVVLGADPEEFLLRRRYSSTDVLPGLHPQTFLYAGQCLAIAEHRRYHKFESKGGGRFLPARFAIGIVEGFWTAADAKAVQRRGRPGVEELENKFGQPTRLKVLAN